MCRTEDLAMYKHATTAACNSERIVVPSIGEPEIFQVVRGKIPSDLKMQLSEPLSESDKNSIFNEVGLLSATSLPKQEKPKVLWLFGPPAVGKSTLAVERTSELFGSNGFVCVDGDEIRDRHPAFRAVTFHGLESRVLHKDAWEILKETGCVEGLKKQILQKAIENRQNITLPDCALKPQRVMEMLKALQDADYEMHAMCLWAPASEAERRGRVRSIRTGKAYSPKFHRASREGTIEVAHYWEEMRQWNQHFQSIQYYDTTAQAAREVDLASFERLGAETSELRRVSLVSLVDPREAKKPCVDERLLPAEAEDRRSRKNWWSWFSVPVVAGISHCCSGLFHVHPLAFACQGVIPAGTFCLLQILRLG